METTSDTAVSFDQHEDRYDAMHRTVEAWIDELVDMVEDAAASDEFQAWLDVQSRFHDYSARNTLLIKHQYPTATRVAGYRTWQTEFNRYVKEGERAIWIWAPIITNRCPECENSVSYHDSIECGYNDTPPEDWDRGLVGFKPAPVFDISQTEGEPLPDLDTASTGDATDLVPALLEAADAFDIHVRIVEPAAWEHGPAKGVCTSRDSLTFQPVVEAKDRSNDADLAVTLLHEFAHARLHFDVDDPGERSKREVEAEAIAYIVGRYFGLDTSNSAFYVAAWQDDDTGGIQDRLNRISTVANEFIQTINRTGENPPHAN